MEPTLGCDPLQKKNQKGERPTHSTHDARAKVGGMAGGGAWTQARVAQWRSPAMERRRRSKGLQWGGTAGAVKGWAKAAQKQPGGIKGQELRGEPAPGNNEGDQRGQMRHDGGSRRWRARGRRSPTSRIGGNKGREATQESLHSLFAVRGSLQHVHGPGDVRVSLPWE